MQRIFGCVLALLMSGGALAQSVLPGTSKPAALENIPQASGVCRKDEPVSRVTAAETHLPDLSCAINPEELLKILGRPEWIIIDSRSAADFATAHLPEAMNILPGLLASKNYLRERSVVLTGSGKSERELYASCSMLKAKGFKQVKVLRGGLPAWLALGMPVSGNPAAVGGMEQLTAAELWTEAQFDANLLLMTPAQRALLTKMARGSELPSLSADALSGAVGGYRKVNRGNAPAAVILAHDKVLLAEELAKLRQAIHPVPLLIYTGDVSAYEVAVKQQNAVWLAQAAGPKQPPCGR